MRAAPDLEQRIVACARPLGVGGIEADADASERVLPPAGRQGPVLPLDVVHQDRVRPGEQVGDDQPDAFARPGRGEDEDVLGALVPQVAEPASLRPDAEEQATGFGK